MAAPFFAPLDPAAQAQADLALLNEVVRALLIRVGGEIVLTGDDLFVGRQCDVQAVPLEGSGLGLRIMMPAQIPSGEQVFCQ